jgi:hypothetical protein
MIAVSRVGRNPLVVEFPVVSAAGGSKITIPGSIPAHNPPPDFDRDYPSREMPVIAGKTRGNGRKIT